MKNIRFAIVILVCLSACETTSETTNNAIAADAGNTSDSGVISADSQVGNKDSAVRGRGGADVTETVDANVDILLPDPCADKICDDSNPCTTDSCEIGQCLHAPVYCEDSNGCTDDICEVTTGKCLHPQNDLGCGGGGGDEPCKTAKDCEDNGACYDDGCEDGQCTHYLVDCDDKNPCTNDTCNNKTVGCVHTPVQNGTTCDD